jgi:hypothetical protein
MNGTTTATTTTEMLNAAFESICEQFHQMVYRAAVHSRRTMIPASTPTASDNHWEDVIFFMQAL